MSVIQDKMGEFKPELIYSMNGHREAVLNIRFTTNSNYLMSCGQDRTVRLWNPHRGLAIKEYKGPHNYEINDVAISSDNFRFVSVGGDKAAFLWDVGSAKVIRKFTGYNGKIYCCELFASDDLLITGSYDKSVKIWDMKDRSRAPIQTLNDCTDSVTCIATVDNTIIVGSMDGSVRTYDVRMAKVLIDSFYTSVVDVALDKTQKVVIVSCLDSTIRLLDRQTGKQLNCYVGHQTTHYRTRAVFDCDQRYVVSGSEDGGIYMWHVYNDTDARTNAKAKTKEENFISVLPKAVEGGEVFAVDFADCQDVVTSGNQIMAACGNHASIKVYKCKSSKG